MRLIASSRIANASSKDPIERRSLACSTTIFTIPLMAFSALLGSVMSDLNPSSAVCAFAAEALLSALFD